MENMKNVGEFFLLVSVLVFMPPKGAMFLRKGKIIRIMGLLESILLYQEWIWAVVIIIASVIAAKAVNFVMKRYAEKVTARTKSVLDDMLLKAVQKPVFLGVFLAGIYFATGRLQAVLPYATEINMGFSVIFILYGAFFAVRVINVFIEWYGTEMAHKTRTKVDEQFLPIFQKIAYLIVFALAFVWILGQLGIEITALIAAMGIGGLAIALALQGTLSNFFSGAYIVLDRPIRIGDYIELDSGDKGTVVDIGWRSTRIRTYTNNLLILPNSKLAESKIINYNVPNRQVGFTIECGVSYNSDLEKVEKIALRVAKDVLKKSGGVEGFEPRVRFREFGDSSINFRVIMRTNTYGNKFKAIHAFIKGIKKAFDRAGIEIPFPQTDVHLYHSRKKR